MALAAAVFLAALAGVPVLASEVDCAPAVERTIQDLAIDRSDIRRMQTFTRTTGRFARWPQMEVWIWFESCKGNIVIDLQPRPDCRVKQVYSRGACSLPAKP